MELLYIPFTLANVMYREIIHVEYVGIVITRSSMFVEMHGLFYARINALDIRNVIAAIIKINYVDSWIHTIFTFVNYDLDVY